MTMLATPPMDGWPSTTLARNSSYRWSKRIRRHVILSTASTRKGGNKQGAIPWTRTQLFVVVAFSLRFMVVLRNRGLLCQSFSWVATQQVTRNSWKQRNFRKATANPVVCRLLSGVASTTVTQQQRVVRMELKSYSGSDDIGSDNGKDTVNDNDESEWKYAFRKGLEEYRFEQAKNVGKSPRMILPDAVLEGICNLQPLANNNLERQELDLASVKGFGPKKLELMGEDIQKLAREARAAVAAEATIGETIGTENEPPAQEEEVQQWESNISLLDSYVAPAPYAAPEDEEDIIAEESYGDFSKVSTSVSESDDKNDDQEPATKTETTTKLRKTQLKTDLKAYRMEQKDDDKAAYTVFTNAALDGIYATLPTTKAELLDVKGIGPKKLELYGDDLLELVAPYAAQFKGGGAQSENVDDATNTNAVFKPTLIDPESLTDEQRKAADWIFERDPITGKRRNVFVTGSAGTGKSHLLKYVVEVLRGKQQHPNGDDDFSKLMVGVCAPTGVAAVIVGGSTLHSFFGIGLGTGSPTNLLKKVRKNNAAVTRIDTTDVLIIDECSMLSSDLLETLDMVARVVRRDGMFSDEPFGGIQIIAFGDFYQLPPVYKHDYEDPSNDRSWRPFCFDSDVWKDLGLSDNLVELREVQRQDHADFVDLLNKVRVGTVGQDDIWNLNRKCLMGPNNPLPNDGILPTRLYVLNRDVDMENQMRLDELQGKEFVSKATDVWRQAMPVGTKAAVKTKMKEALGLELPEEVRFKVGAQVMLTRNRDVERNLVNGSRGVVERIYNSPSGNPLPVVRFDSGQVVQIDPVESMRYNPDGNEGCLVRQQVPLKLAWAVTVHKSQGSTLTRASLDISSAFEYGQCYVALSRVRSLEGLWLERPVQLRNVMVSPQVINFLQER